MRSFNLVTIVSGKPNLRTNSLATAVASAPSCTAMRSLLRSDTGSRERNRGGKNRGAGHSLSGGTLVYWGNITRIYPRKNAKSEGKCESHPTNTHSPALLDLHVEIEKFGSEGSPWRSSRLHEGRLEMLLQAAQLRRAGRVGRTAAQLSGAS